MKKRGVKNFDLNNATDGQLPGIFIVHSCLGLYVRSTAKVIYGREKLRKKMKPGYAIAERLGLDGAQVSVSSREQKNVDAAVKAMRAKNIDVIGTVCDVGKAEERANMIRQTVNEFGGIDILVSNAVFSPPACKLLETPEWVWKKVFEVNVEASFLLCKEIVPYIQKRGMDSMDDILESVGLPECKQVFSDNLITKEVVVNMADQDFQTLGITTIGDRVRLRQACRDQLSSHHMESPVLKRLKYFQENRQKVRNKPKNNSKPKITRRVHIGWKHSGKLVHATKGGGKQVLDINKDLPLIELQSVVCDKFFPDGKNLASNLILEDLTFSLTTFTGKQLESRLSDGEPFTLQGYINEHGVSPVRLYLCTEVKGVAEETEPEQIQEVHRDINNDDSDDFEYTDTPTITFRRSRALVERLRLRRRMIGDYTLATESATYSTTESNVAASTESNASTFAMSTVDTSAESTAATSTESASATSTASTAATSTESTAATSTESTAATSTASTAATSTESTAATSTASTAATSTESTAATSTASTAATSTESTAATSTESTTVPVPECYVDIESSCYDGPQNLTLKDILSWWIGKTVINVDEGLFVLHRENILKCTMRTVKKDHFNYCHPFKVVFSGEDGEDFGGPKREFLRLLMNEVKEECFQGHSGTMFFRHDIEKIAKKTYEVAGSLVAFSILHGGPGLPVLHQSVFEIIAMGDCETLPSIEDCILDIDQCQKFKAIQQASDDQTYGAALAEIADWAAEQGLQLHNKKLSDKDDVVEILIRNEICYRVRSEIDQFKEGMNNVGFFLETLRLAPNEFKELFTYHEKKLSFSSFRSLYKVQYSPQGSNYRRMEGSAIYCLEAFLADCEGGASGVSLNEVLCFWTGASSLPPLGFQKDLEVCFGVDKRLPSAHTCSLVLNIWRGYNDPDNFAEDMEKSIKWGGGFHLA